MVDSSRGHQRQGENWAEGSEDPVVLRANPWFEAGGTVPFLVFDDHLTALTSWLGHVTHAVQWALGAEREARTRELIELGQRGWWGAAELDLGDDDLVHKEVLFPILAFGALLPAAFGALEQLIMTLVARAEEQGLAPFKSFEGDRNKGNIVNARAYLRDVAEWSLSPWSEYPNRRLYAALLTLRNKVAHTLTDGLSKESLRDLAAAMEWSDGVFRWEPALVDATLSVAGDFASDLQDAIPPGFPV